MPDRAVVSRFINRRLPRSTREQNSKQAAGIYNNAIDVRRTGCEVSCFDLSDRIGIPGVEKTMTGARKTLPKGLSSENEEQQP